MKPNFNKLISSAAIVFAIVESAWAQQKMLPPPPFEQGYELSKEKYPAAINAPASITVQTSWDFFLSGSFLYWRANQDAMEIAATAVNLDGVYSGAAGSVVKQHSSYKPGFKLGLGIDFHFDDWVGFIEYTRFHQSSSNKLGSPQDSRTGTPLWVATAWYGFNTDPDTTPFAYATNIHSKWQSNFDVVDADVGRPYYQGRKLTVDPFGGLRIALIRQNFRMSLPPVSVSRNVVSHNKSNSWAAGPRAGFTSRWLLGGGFRMEGDLSANLLYTRYTTVAHREDSFATVGLSYNVQAKDINALRPMADLKIGLGWGSYSDQQHYHLDLLATYDFVAMWSQNMMRSMVNSLVYNTSAPADLFLQGLNLTARLDF